MNKIWLLMMLASLIVLLYVDPGATLSTMIDASTSALTLCIELCAVYVVWLGLLEIVDATGLGQKLAKLLRPLIKKLFRVDNEEIEKMMGVEFTRMWDLYLASCAATFNNGIIDLHQILMSKGINNSIPMLRTV